MKRFLPLLLIVLSACVSDPVEPRGEAAPPIPGGYPRLSMWWPNSWEQSAHELARYDYIAWGYWADESMLNRLKEMNPDQLHFNSPNSVEVVWEWFEDPEFASMMAEIPAEWFLTQQGSRLADSIDEVQREIPIESTRNSQGEDLFERGDLLVCGAETMEVRRVDHQKSVLHVNRGEVRRAVSHISGTRIAPHVSFWPETWVMNVSTMCPIVQPLGTQEPAMQWSRWVAQRMIPTIYHREWDGYLLDRVDPGQSWLVPDFARSLDPRCSNESFDEALIRDFDQAWIEGQTQVLILLREQLNGGFLLANSFGAYWDSLNGAVYESCPGNWSDTEPETWEDWAAGGRPYVLGEEGYIHVSQSGFQPNFSTIETYELESMPDGTERNPMERPGWEPNYQRMRWGLTTALLGDGYFSYEIATWGHGSLGLMWFDEYDNAGLQRGYLGQPLGEARVIEDLGDQGKIYRRDFQGGIVLCNPSNQGRRIILEEPYRLIRGSQDPQVNSGELVEELYLDSKDGRILLREP